MIRPYLSFDGQCEAAFGLYERAFGGKIEYMEKYGDHAPDPAMRDRVRHAEMQLTETGGIAGADAAAPFQRGEDVSLMIRVGAEAKLRAIWAVLAESGTVIAELAPFENNGLMGALRGRYGFTWIFTLSGQ